MSVDEEGSITSNNNNSSKVSKSDNTFISDNELSNQKKPNSIEILGNKIGNKGSADLSFKIIVIGDSSVGKSSLINKAIRDNFDVSYNATIGFEYCDLFMRVDGKIIKLQIWDTCGQEIYQSVITNFYRNSSVALMVYAIDNKKSFEHISYWLKEIKKASNPDAKVILIGNKSDLDENREVTYDEAKNYSEDFEFSNFYEVSAKKGINVEKIFIEIANLLIKNYNDYYSTSSVDVDRSSDRKDVSKLEKDENNIRVQKPKASCC